MERPTDSPPSQEHLGVWKPWNPGQVARRLRHIAIPWCVAGGWAIDLWQGRQTRPHEDIEISIPRPCFPAIRSRLSAFKLFSVSDGEVHALPDGGMPPEDKHQNWVLDETAKAWRLDIFLEPGDADVWVFRRNETICGPRSRMVANSAEGIPYLKPEAVLLFKAKWMRDKDEADFATCVPRMQQDERAWLKDALQRVHPGHSWLSRLD